jgi:RNA polymerase sigma-B factor
MPLSHKKVETLTLIKEFQKNPNNESVITELFKRYDELIFSIAGSYTKRADLFEDLVQVGRMGLFSAITRFNPNYNCRFETYAIPTIKGEMKRYIRDKTWTLRVPRKFKDLSYKIKEAIVELEVELQRSPLIKEIAEKLNVSEEDILQTMEASNNYKALSLDQDRTEPNQNSRASFCLMDKIPSDELKCIYELTDNRLIVEHMLQALSEREQKIVYYLYYKQLSQSQVAEEIGISQMHVSRLHRSALKKLKSEFSHYKKYY